MADITVEQLRKAVAFYRAVIQARDHEIRELRDRIRELENGSKDQRPDRP